MILFLRVPASVALAASLTCAAMAQEQPLPGVDALCRTPPLTEAARDRIRRQAGHARRIEAMAADCPAVAMLFALFVVGEVAHSPHQEVLRHPPDFLFLIGPERIFACCEVAAIP